MTFQNIINSTTGCFGSPLTNPLINQLQPQGVWDDVAKVAATEATKAVISMLQAGPSSQQPGTINPLTAGQLQPQGVWND
ncbi:hypothetical protein MHL30_19345, partial [Priestia flexa]|uniref:hypothetical protein n=1 Tax=Priestia flexa TaxID=86664 RepID=UPI001EF57026